MKLDRLKTEMIGIFKSKASQHYLNKFFYSTITKVQCSKYNNSFLWKYGTEVELLGQVHYLIDLLDVYVKKGITMNIAHAKFQFKIYISRQQLLFLGNDPS